MSPIVQTAPSFALSLIDRFQIHAPPPISRHLYRIIASFAVRRRIRNIHPGPPSGAHAQAIQDGRLRLVSADFACRAGRYRREHSRYKGAEMPHMQRLTWGGVAMHAGLLPGYPASHGCVRLPEDFATKLYEVTHVGTTVIIADNSSGPGTTTNPGLVFAGTTAGVPAGAMVWQPEKAPKGPVSIIISAADGAGYIYRDGVEIGRAPIGGLRGIRGSYAFSALATVDASGRRDWLSMASVGKRVPNLKELATRISVDPTFLANVRKLITSGTSMIVTDAPVNAQTRSGSGFKILTSS
jgi:hypothetical protein